MSKMNSCTSKSGKAVCEYGASLAAAAAAWPSFTMAAAAPQLPARPAPAIEQGQHNTAPAQLSYTPGTTRTTQSGQSGSEIFGCTQNGAKTSTSALPLLLSQFHADQ